MIATRLATPGDAPALAPRLRASDRREIAALSGGDPEVALRAAVARSTEARAIEIGGRVEALYGHYAPPALGNSAMVWAMGSNTLPRYAKSLIREMQEYLAGVEMRYGGTTNIVDADNAPAIRLLRRLGYEIGERALAAPGGGRALTFWRRERV